MEAVLAMPSPDRGREYVLPLSLCGIRVRAVVQSGNQLVAELGREPADCVLLPETLPDGPAEMWLTRAAAVCTRRPLAVVLVYGVDGSEAVRERVRTAYGPAADAVAAGARSSEDVAAEAARVLERISRLMAEQDVDAFERLRQPVAPGVVPQPVRKGGAVALLGASGGVGTSTAVANLAAYAAMAGQRVLVVDAHFATGGTTLYHLGMEPDDHNAGMHHLRWSHTSQNGAVRESMAEELVKYLADAKLRGIRHAEIKVLHVPAVPEQMASIPADHVLWAMQVLERNFDLTLLDCGTGLGDGRTQKLLEQAGRIFLVAGGWGSSVSALVRTLASMENRPERERLFLLLREAEGAYGSRTVRSLAGLPIFGRLPEEPLLRKLEARLGARIPVAVDAPDSPYGKAIAGLAFSLGLTDGVEGKGQARNRKGFLAMFAGRA